MPIVRSALLAVAASLFAATAFAMPDSYSAPAAPQPQPQDTQPAPAPDNSAMPAPSGMSAATGAAADTSATVDANGVVWHSAQPVPDTPANRAAYGQPMSRTGRLTRPIGD
jgi:hypothetical protein